MKKTTKLFQMVTLNKAAKKTLGGSGNATEFGRPQGRNK